MNITQKQLTEHGVEITVFDMNDAYLTIGVDFIKISSNPINQSSIWLNKALFYIRPDSFSIVGDDEQVIYYTNKKKDITIMNDK